MARDALLVKRDAFVIPGGLLVAFGLIGLAFVLFVRTPSYCDESTRVLLAGACYSLVPLGVLPILVGALLLAVGLIKFRAKPDSLEGHLHHGAGLHFSLALLASLVVIPLVAAASIRILEEDRGTSYTIRIGGVLWQESFLFEVVALVALLMLVPLALLAARQVVMRRRFLDEADRFAEEGSPAAGTGRVPASQESLPAEELVPEGMWPASRSSERAVANQPGAFARPAPTPARPIAAAPAASAQAILAATPTGPLCESCGNPANLAGIYCSLHGCQAVTSKGQPCPGSAVPGTSHCVLHGG